MISVKLDGSLKQRTRIDKAFHRCENAIELELVHSISDSLNMFSPASYTRLHEVEDNVTSHSGDLNDTHFKRRGMAR